jgi:hypothetical protein
MVFVSIASYCDPLLSFTIEQALATASSPDQLRFGIIDQGVAPLPNPPSQYRFIAAIKSRGVCWARAEAMKLYRGEDWFLQIDSHTIFDAGWDENLIDRARALGPRTVITTYPNGFLVKNEGFAQRNIRTQKVLALRVIDDVKFEGLDPILRFESDPIETDDPVPAIHLGACCLFSEGGFVKAFPYDPGFYFLGEEQSMFLRAYTHGWNIVHTPAIPIYHFYGIAQVELTKRPFHWDPDHDALRPIKHLERHRLSQQRLNDLLAGKLLGRFGLGTARTLADYAAFSGIDYIRRTIQPRAYRADGAIQAVPP